jgi:hypothetical protein
MHREYGVAWMKVKHEQCVYAEQEDLVFAGKSRPRRCCSASAVKVQLLAEAHLGLPRAGYFSCPRTCMCLSRLPYRRVTDVIET